MLECWNLAPDHRPSFSNIVSCLQNLLSQDYLDVNSQSETTFTTNNQSESMYAPINQSELEVSAEKEKLREIKEEYPSMVSILCQDDQYLEPIMDHVSYSTRNYNLGNFLVNLALSLVVLFYCYMGELIILY